MTSLIRVLLAVVALSGAAAAAERVDAIIVLGADVSRSIDALTSPRVLAAIRSGNHGAVAICFFEWAGVGQQKLVVDWTVVRDLASAQRVAAIVEAAPRSYYGSTALGAAIDFGMRLLARAPVESDRQVIDISGDGTNTGGPSIAAARDAAVEAGITINALVILSPVPNPFNPYHTHPPEGLEEYFRRNVIGGYGAFTVVADGFEAFADAMINKLIREIAALP
jgi:hypothetical protein